MSQTTLCRNLGVREGEGHLFEVGIIALQTIMSISDKGIAVRSSYCISACRMERSRHFMFTQYRNIRDSCY